MTRSVYVIGGAGVGKSTFTGQLLDGREFGPKEVIYDLPMGETKRPNPMHGQRLSGDGLYLGVQRDSFPGSDGLSRTCGTSGAAWLALGGLPRYIVSEGQTLATRRFLTALHEHTELLLVYLTASPEVLDAHLAARGAGQPDSLIRRTATRAQGLAAYMRDLGVLVMPIDVEESWDLGLDLARTYLP